MRIENNTIRPLSLDKNFAKPEKSKKGNFADLLKQSINNVNQLQKTADITAEKFAAGEIDSVHRVTIATEEAKLALDMTMAVRNKVVSAYKEIMRMQF